MASRRDNYGGGGGGVVVLPAFSRCKLSSDQHLGWLRAPPAASRNPLTGCHTFRWLLRLSEFGFLYVNHSPFLQSS